MKKIAVPKMVTAASVKAGYKGGTLLVTLILVTPMLVTLTDLLSLCRYSCGGNSGRLRVQNPSGGDQQSVTVHSRILFTISLTVHTS